MSEEHPYVKAERLMKEQFNSGELPGWLARGSYHILPSGQLLPDMFFHHKDVKETLRKMREGKVKIGKKKLVRLNQIVL